MVIGVKSMKV